MQVYKCKSCGANDFSEVNGQIVCNYCGTSYIAEKKVETHQDTQISINGDVAVLLDKIKADPTHTRRYVNLILDIDPTNQQVLKYLS